MNRAAFWFGICILVLAAAAIVGAPKALAPTWLGSFAPFTSLSQPQPQQNATSTPAASGSVPYVEVLDSCNYAYEGTCVNMRSGPGTQYPVVMHLRQGVVLKVAGTETDESGRQWYQVLPGSELHFPERVVSMWFVAADLVNLTYEAPDQVLTAAGAPPTQKKIIVNLKDEMLYAYDGDTLFMQTPISRGLDATPTPRGTYSVLKMTPARYMQGPTEQSPQFYDLPGVPWDLYFTEGGAVIHGAYWHNSFGSPWSHGCINTPVSAAKELYHWAQIGMPVIVE